MTLSVPRLLGIVAAVEAFYLGTTALIYFAGLGQDASAFSVFWRAFWPIVLACGAYVLWLDRIATSLLEAMVRSLLIWAVVVANFFLVVALFVGRGV